MSTFRIPWWQEKKYDQWKIYYIFKQYNKCR